MSDTLNFIFSYIAYPLLFILMNWLVEKPNYKTAPRSFWNLGFVFFSFLFCMTAIPLFIYYGMPILDWVNNLAASILGIAPFLNVIKSFVFFLLVLLFLLSYNLLKWGVRALLDLVKGDNILPIEETFYCLGKPGFLLKRFTWLKEWISFINVVGIIILIALLPYLYQKLALDLVVGIVLLTLLVLKETVLFFQFLELEKEEEKEKPIEWAEDLDFDLNQFERLWRYFINSPFTEKRLITARKSVDITSILDTEKIKNLSFPDMSGKGYLRLLKLPYVTRDMIDLREMLSAPPKGKDVIPSGLDAEVSILTIWDRVTEVLNNGEHVLVLLPERNLPEVDREGKPELSSYYSNCVDWVRKTLDQLLDVHYFTVQTFSALRPENIIGNILVTSSYDLLEGRNTLELSKDWFDNTGFILVMSYEDQIKAGNFNNLILSNILRRLKINCQLAVVSGPQEQLESSVRSAFEMHPGIEEKETHAITAHQQYYFIWRDEGRAFASYFLRGHHSNTDLGDSLMLTLPAINLMTKNISIYNPDKWAVKEFIEETQKVINKIDPNKLPDPVNWNYPDILLRKLVGEIYNHNFYTHQPEGFAVVYDYAFNAGETLSEALTFYRKAEMVHVLAAPYLFREYFSANIQFFKDSPVRSLGVVLQRTPYTIAYSLFKILRINDVSEKDVESKLKLKEVRFAVDVKKTTIENLENLWVKYLQLPDSQVKGLVKVKQEETFEPLEKGRSYSFVTNTYFNKGDLRNFTFDFESEVYVQENTPTGSVVLDIIPKGLLFQKYVVGQIHVFKGKTYGVRGYDDSDKTRPVLWVQLDNTQGKVAAYRSATTIKFCGEKPALTQMIETRLVNNTYEVSLWEGEFEINTHGYFRITEEFNLFNRQNFYPADSTQDSQVSRKYAFGRYVLLELPIAKFEAHTNLPDFMQHEQTLAALLHESLRTFFPSVWPYVHATAMHAEKIVCPGTDDKGFVQPFLITPEGHPHKKESSLQVIIFEDCAFDMGIAGSIYRNMEYVTGVLEDYLNFCNYETVKSSRADGDAPVVSGGFQNCVAPLDTVEMEGVQFDPVSSAVYLDLPLFYLNFGRTETPEWLYLKGAQKLLKTMRAGRSNAITEKRQQFLFGEVEVSETGNKHQCDFCGQWEDVSTIKAIQNDGREICSNCIVTCVTTCEELVECISFSRDFLTKEYSISLPENVEIKYANAHMINKHRKGFVPTPRFDPRVAGFAQSDNLVAVENGAPKKDTIAVLTHELVHIWQYKNLDMDRMRKDYELFLIEGHATWVEINVRRKIRPEVNWEELIAPATRRDEYGEGFRLIKKMVGHYKEDPFVFLNRLYPK